MKIAVITDDVKTISEHFEHAQYYLVFSVKKGIVTGQELRLKNTDSYVADQEYGIEQKDLQHADLHSTTKHSNMMGTIIDCDVLLARGMDRSSYDGLKIRSIQPIITDIEGVQLAVDAYLAGNIIDHHEYLY
jgi:predicted Fe-Mo cluster-binding NifX family protein